MKHILLFLVVGGFCLRPWAAAAQGEYSNWYFGQQADVRFRPPAAPQSGLDGALVSPSACATLSDAAGNLLLYSDGDRVWNRQHQLMPGGAALGGSSTVAQGCAVLRSPNAASAVAYLFTQLRDLPIDPFSTGLPVAAEVQLTATGQVTQTGLAVVADSILQRLGERSFAPYQTLVRHANGRDAWLITRLHVQGVFLASLVDGSGRWPCARTVVSRVLPNRIASSATWGGGLVASPNGRTLLYNDVAMSWLLAFDPATGRVGTPLFLRYPVPTIATGMNPYTLGGAFSPDGQRLYLNRLYGAISTSLGNSAVQVLQYDLAAGSPAAVAASAIEIYNVADRNGAKNLPWYSQRGPDGLVYFAVPESTALDAILSPNARGRACRYTPGYLLLRGRTAGRALPAQPNDVNLGPLLAPEPAVGCTGYRVVLRAGASGGGGTDSLRWLPGDGRPAVFTPAAVDTLAIAYAVAGTYTVRIERRRQGVVLATATAVVRIGAAPRVRLAQGPDTIGCAPLGLRLSVGTQPVGTRYGWQDGSTAATLIATAPGTYWVDVVSDGGCIARATVEVREQRCPVVATTLPDIITPNNDSQNQAFILKGLNAPDWSLRLYNRWGREIYRQQQYDNTWAATGQPDGTYFYLLTNTKTSQKIKGWVEVRR